MKRIPTGRRHSEINVTGLDSVTHTGTGDGLAAAVRDLEARYTLTLDGAIVVCADRTNAYIDDPSTERAVRMEQAYELAERIAERGRH